MFVRETGQYGNIYVGQMLVKKVWLVHYANRTLNKIVGKMDFNLGTSKSLTSEDLIEKLGIVRA